MSNSEKGKHRQTNILQQWGLDESEVAEIVEANPSLRGMLFGYICEYKARKMFFNHPEFSEVKKYDDHDRSKKCDISFQYQGVEILVEVKALQTNSVKSLGENRWAGDFQCDASDRRDVALPDGGTILTTCLKTGGFDIIAVALFAFGNKWQFAFARNADLPRSTSNKYPPHIRAQLIKSNIKISLPLHPPFTEALFPILDLIVAEKNATAAL